MNWYLYVSVWKPLFRMRYELIFIRLGVKTTVQCAIWTDINIRFSVKTTVQNAIWTDIYTSRCENHCSECDMNWYLYVSVWKPLFRVRYELILIYDSVWKPLFRSAIWTDTYTPWCENHCSECDMNWYWYVSVWKPLFRVRYELILIYVSMWKPLFRVRYELILIYVSVWKPLFRVRYELILRRLGVKTTVQCARVVTQLYKLNVASIIVLTLVQYYRKCEDLTQYSDVRRAAAEFKRWL